VLGSAEIQAIADGVGNDVSNVVPLTFLGGFAALLFRSLWRNESNWRTLLLAEREATKQARTDATSARIDADKARVEAREAKNQASAAFAQVDQMRDRVARLEALLVTHGITPPGTVGER
jgi:hypothetical protein